MIVDDETHILIELKSLLKDEYHIITAEDGKQALDIVSNLEHPENLSLVISDQRMPKYTGVEFFEQIVKKKLVPDAVRIILTGYVDIPIMIDATNKAHIYQYILKPFDPGEFVQTIKRAIQKYEDQKTIKDQNRRLEEKNKHLKESTLIDSDTSLGNRKFFDQTILKDIHQIDREYSNLINKQKIPVPPESCLALIVLNINEFINIGNKERNAADAVLDHLGKLLLEKCRKSDIAVRWDRQQLMIVGRFVSREHAPKITERIHEEILNKKKELEQKEKLSLRFSIGFSCYPLIKEEPDQIPWTDVVDIANQAIKFAESDSWVGLIASKNASPDAYKEHKTNIKKLIDLGVLQIISSLNYGNA